MKFSILFLLIVFPCDLVSAEPLFGFNIIADLFHSANEVIGKSIEVVQNVVSDVITGVSSTSKNIYHTIFGRETPPATGDNKPIDGQNSSSPQNRSSENEIKSNASKGSEASEASDSNKSTNDNPKDSKESSNSAVSADKE